jgi:cytosine/adenosine deaminase-related metal-dependent hydrolase
MTSSAEHRHATLVLRARYVFPVTGEPIPDGFVAVEGGRIVEVGRCGAGVPPAHGSETKTGAGKMPALHKDLGNAAILPGLVNAHAHLDFSGLGAPLGRRGIGLSDWIRLAMDYRRRAADCSPASVAAGLDECLRCGVTTLGDIVQPDANVVRTRRVRTTAGLNVVAFLELIAPTADRVAAALELAKSHLDVVRTRRVRDVDVAGLGPHAPYSVHPELLDAVVELSATQAVPVTMHLAESREELEWLREGTGPLRTLLDELGAANGRGLTAPGNSRRLTAAGESGARPMDYLRRLASAHRTLVVHGNYLADDEIAFLGTQAARMAVVYCPRSHDWFAHRDYPLQEMLAAGVTVALGTDGRGSSPDLSLLGEMRFAARRHPDVGLDRILRMGTIVGAKALGQEDELGSLMPGKRADLAIVALPDRDAADPHELLFDSTEPVVGCSFCGVEAYRSGKTATS